MAQYHEQHGVFPKRQPGEDYNVEQCVKAYIELIKKEKATSTRTKVVDEYRQAKAARERLKLDQERGTLVLKVDVIATCKFILTVVKTSLLNLVKSLPPLVEGKTQEETEIILDAEIIHILTALSDGFNEIKTPKATK